MAINPDEFRAVMGRFATGVTILTARDPEERDHGMTVSAFCSASLAPPLVLVCIAHVAEMHAVLEKTSHFAINILSETQEQLSRRFAELPSAGRFDGIGYARADSGVVLLDDAIGHLECHAVSKHLAGDHTVVVGEVEWAASRQDRPLLYYRGGYAQLER